jgi:hypothetical protein
MSKILGQFYFKRSTNGNLLGEFTNNESEKITAESANLIGSSTNFTGTYKSTWQHEKEACFATLTIEFMNEQKTQYLLKWASNDGFNYWGEGFLVDNILIGHYRDFEAI